MRFIKTQDKEALIPILGDNQNYIFYEELSCYDEGFGVYYGRPCDEQLWLGTYSSRQSAIDAIDYIYQAINSENSAIKMPEYF